MPRYFFHVLNSDKSPDLEGIELPNLEAAKVEAKKDVEEIIQTEFNSLGADWAKWSIEICDEKGNLLFVLPFSTN
jgi:uncharacterized protein DUF6894